MAATIHPAPSPDRARVAPLRVIEGGRSPRRPAARYRRRRVVAAVLVVALVGLLVAGADVAVGSLWPAVPGARPAPVPGPVAAGPATGPVVVVRPGDTLWAIARRIAPGGDVRVVVDRLAAVHGTGPLQVGERVPIAAAKAGGR